MGAAVSRLRERKAVRKHANAKAGAGSGAGVAAQAAGAPRGNANSGGTDGHEPTHGISHLDALVAAAAFAPAPAPAPGASFSTELTPLAAGALEPHAEPLAGACGGDDADVAREVAHVATLWPA